MPSVRLDPEQFARRRRAALERMEEGSAMLLFGAPVRIRNADSEHRYRQDSDLLYLAGWEQPGVVLFLRPGVEDEFVLFVQGRSEEEELWTGARPGPEGAVSDFGADRAWPLDQLDQRLPELLLGVRTLYYAAGEDHEHDRRVLAAIRGVARRARRELLDLPDAFVHPGRVLHELRLRKSPEELGLLREAARVSAEAHLAAMRAAHPGAGEWEIEALVDYTFRRMGGTGPGYATIVGSGANACVLHYVENSGLLRAGDLVLVDAGCEYRGYTADISRTFPVSGRFEGAALELYGVVLRAQREVVEAVRPGATQRGLQELAARRLTEGMVEIGLLEGEPEQLIEQEAWRRYYPHNIGHWLGMDVHDAGRYHRAGASIALEPGMVLTVEPGLYVPEGDERAPEAFRGLGVRIEDDVVVGDGEPEVLTAAVPKEIDEVEAACG